MLEKAKVMQLIIRVFLGTFIFTMVACDSSSTAQAESQTTEAPQPLAKSEAVEMPQQPDVSQVSLSADSPPLSKSERLEKSLKDMEDQMGIDLFVDPWTGDLDAMAKERVIRVLTVYGIGRYYLDGGQEKGITYEWFKQFEDFVNEKLANHLGLERSQA